QAELSSRLAHELRRAAHQSQRCPDELEIQLRFLRHEVLEQLRRQSPLGVAERQHKAGSIVEAEILSVVLLARQRDAFVREHALQRVAVLRLVVYQHAVEVEQHGFGQSVSFNHATTLGQQAVLARLLTTNPRCDNPGATASILRAAPTRSTTCRHAFGGAKIQSAPPATPRYGVLSAARP